MKWRDAHQATLARYGGRLPNEDEVRLGDQLVPDLVFETDDGTDKPIGRWLVADSTAKVFSKWRPDKTMEPASVERGATPRWTLWDMRAFVDGRGQPVLVAANLPTLQRAVLIAEVLDASRALRSLRAAVVGLGRAVAEVRREWRT